MKSILLTAACIAAPLAALFGVAAYDGSARSDRYEIGTTWSGEKAIFHYEDGRLFADSKGENIGYFGGGRPRVLGFGCAGRAGVLIAMEESDLPICKKVEPIAGASSLAWS